MEFACWIYYTSLVSGLLAIFVARGLCTEVGGALSSVNESGHAPCSYGSVMCNRLRTAINFLSFFPCLNDSMFVAAKDCDVFAYPAALLLTQLTSSLPNWNYPFLFLSA